ncbi:hypothetical protein WMW72_22120 [Paenibacillus filicis]|uniref:Uncharacterized protein n=1 Tax=Paenibacillus filicis TaxID=669464 RepID=A0ABU9DQT3_9BACL
MTKTTSVVGLAGGMMLRVKQHGQGVVGEIIMPDANGQDSGTLLFHSPPHSSVEELTQWSNLAVRAYVEG